MKRLILCAFVLTLTGCAVISPTPSKNVIVYPPVRVQPTVEIVYIWDPVQYRYYWVDRRDSRHYMPHDWKHPHGHKPPGHDHWDIKK